MKINKKNPSLQTMITVFVCVVVISSLLITGILVGKEITLKKKDQLSSKATNIAKIIASTPLVIDGLIHPENSKKIQHYANDIRHKTGVRYIVVMDMHGIRKSHPNDDKVGKHFVGGDEKKALRGKAYTSVAVGTLGTSLRSFEPILDNKGTQVGVVAVGILSTHIHEAVVRSISIIYTGISVGLLFGVIGAIILARKIKKTLFGLEPLQIASLWQERNAMLESVREGILAVNPENKIIVANTEAHRIFQDAGISEELVGKNIEDYLPGSRLQHVVENGKAEYDQEIKLNGIILVANRVPLMVENQVIGAIATFRDKTELKQLAEQLTGVKLYAEALRVKSHEFMNKLHVILGMIHIKEYEKLAAYVHQISDHYQFEVGSISNIVKNPVLAGFLLSKLSYAREQGVLLNISGGSSLPIPNDSEVINECITILGNLIDNGIDAVEACEMKHIDVILNYESPFLTFSVRDNGPGISGDSLSTVFEKGFSTKGDNRGYGLFLVQNSVEKLGGHITLKTGYDGTLFTIKLPIESKGEEI